MPTKKHAPPAYRSSAPVCDCGSGIPRSETAEIPSSGGRRGCEKCYNRKYAAYADTDGGAGYSDDPSSGSGWHYSRNPPQRYTVTEGGRRVRLAGGNVFSSKGDAQRAVQFLRATEGGDYRVRAIKPGDSVGRVAVANGKKSTPSRKKRDATGVRRSMSNGGISELEAAVLAILTHYKSFARKEELAHIGVNYAPNDPTIASLVRKRFIAVRPNGSLVPDDASARAAIKRVDRPSVLSASYINYGCFLGE